MAIVMNSIIVDKNDEVSVRDRGDELSLKIGLDVTIVFKDHQQIEHLHQSIGDYLSKRRILEGLRICP